MLVLLLKKLLETNALIIKSIVHLLIDQDFFVRRIKSYSIVQFIRGVDYIVVRLKSGKTFSGSFRTF